MKSNEITPVEARDIAIKESHDLYQSMEKLVIGGDLASLSPHERVTYYNKVCESLGLNPLTKPFSYIRLSGKLTLYASKDATEQLRKIHDISIEILSRELVDDLYIVTARATDKTGRQDEAIGAVSLAGLRGEAKANAIMKCETKSKRRVTLSIAGLGMLDEHEVHTIEGAKLAEVNYETGEIVGAVAFNERKPAIEPVDAKVKLQQLIQGDQELKAWVYDSLKAKGVHKWAGVSNEQAEELLKIIKDEEEAKQVHEEERGSVMMDYDITNYAEVRGV